jgi:hypothetical protein
LVVFFAYCVGRIRRVDRMTDTMDLEFFVREINGADNAHDADVRGLLPTVTLHR